MTFKKILPVLIATAALTACSDGWFGDGEPKAPLPGERISVLDFERELRPEEGAKIAPFSAPEASANPAWTQAGGSPTHNNGHMALSSGELKRLWSTSIGSGTRSRLPLTTQPVIAGQSIFTLDTDSKLSSFSTEDGKRRWVQDVRPDGERDPVIGGGIAVDGGVLYVTSGYNELLAMDAQTGAVKWRVPLPTASRAAPSISHGRVYVTTLNNTLFAVNAADGTVEWEFAGLGQNTGLIGAASPAIVDDLVLPAFSSGELYALRSANGSVTWSDNLANSLRLGGLSGLSDIRALPVVDDNIVYAISFGGKMAAIDLLTGARVWQRDISSAKTPAVVGNRIFLISNQEQVVALNKADGSVVWVSQLARFKNAEKRTGPIFWTGPIMAGNRLIVFSTDGRVAEINPEQGTLARQWSSGRDVKIAPIVVNGTLYILGEDGNLSAYR